MKYLIHGMDIAETDLPSNTETPSDITGGDKDSREDKRLLTDNADCQKETVLRPRPEAPLDSDCCGLGCSSCVFDRYEEEIKTWEAERVKLQTTFSFGDGGKSETVEHLAVLEYRKFSIVSIDQEACNSYIYTVQVKPCDNGFSLIGQHVVVRSEENGCVITREYTPVLWESHTGHLSLLIKFYRFGKMSRHLQGVREGDILEMRGPCGGFDYQPNKWQRIYMLAAGTGLAPMVQLIQRVLTNEKDDTLIYLYYSCKKYEDLLLKSQLDEWSAFWNVTIKYYLTQDIEERVGRIQRYGENCECCHLSLTHLSEIFSPLTCLFQVFVCGTESFNLDMMNYLKHLHIAQGNIHKF